MDDLAKGRRIPAALRGVLVGGIAGGLLFGGLAELHLHRLSPLHAETAAEHETVSGKLSMMDMAGQRGVITTDLGKDVAFQIAKPELFLNLSVGQRITLKLDHQGRAVRVMDNTAPELPPPSDPR